MKLNDKQIQEIKLLYGDNVDAADIALDIIRKKKNLPGVFDKDDFINHTVEEFEKLIQLPKVYKYIPEEYNPKKTILEATKTIKECVKTAKYSTLELVETEIRFIKETINRRYKKLSGMMVKNIDKEIEGLEKRKQIILEDVEEIYFN